MPSERSLQRAAQAWCRPTTEKIVMIPELADVFAEILDSERAEMRQERDDDAWAHAACLTIAETGQKWGPNVTPSLAMQAVHSPYHDREQLKQWVSDCQSGMYINCVYCGHRRQLQMRMLAQMGLEINTYFDRDHDDQRPHGSV